MRDHFWFPFARFGFSAAALLCFIRPVSAQSTTARATPADQAWTTLTTLSRTANDTKVTAVGIVAASREEASKTKNERAQRAQQFRTTAQVAKEFYSQNPSHPKASEARKLEALASLQGITPTDRNYERTALATAAAFRTNKANPVADRIAVAHAVESREITRKTLGRPWFANPVMAEMMLDRLQLEFGHQPEIWAHRLSLAENTYCDAGRDAAYRVVQSPYAPASTRAAARTILERYALIRKPLDFPLTPTQGRSTTLAEVAGKTTIVCFWDGTKHPEGPPGLHDYKKNAQPNTKWVYISVGSPGALPKGHKANAAPPGTTSIEPLGWKSPVVTRLQITQLPYVFVLDEKKQLSGYGRVDEIPDLLKGIGRRALP